MKEEAFGFIPFYQGERGLEVFLIHQYGSGGDILWTFPKGRPEKNESPIETALRELHEETGLSIDSYNETKKVSTSYSFERNGIIVNKTSTYYVGYVVNQIFTIQPEEVKEAGWFLVNDAFNQLTFPDYKTLLTEAVRSLDK